MRHQPLAFALATLLSLPAARLHAVDDPVAVTFQEVKTFYREKNYAKAQEALHHLAELIAAPEREAIRPQVLPAFHFYSGAVAYAEKDEDRARDSLRQFFALNPDASIDPAAYPKSFRIFFDAQRTEAARLARGAAPPGRDAIGGGVLPSFATRDVEEAAIPANNGTADWEEGPVKFLMTPDEKKAFHALPDDDARRLFVNDFWRKRDPKPLTDENEFEAEFYRRVQYCDANFSTEAVRGSLSDRGMVFLLLGPPSYVGRATLRPGQDPINAMRNSRTVTVTVTRDDGTIVRVQRPLAPVPVSPGTTPGEVETWYYRRDRLMKGLPYAELQYQFITQRGYGTAVLQKEPVPLTALRAAAKILRNHGS